MQKRLTYTLLLVAACGAEPEVDVQTTAAEILNGTQVTARTPVVSVKTQLTSSRFCSGVLITNRWVLTNKHCLVEDLLDLDSTPVDPRWITVGIPGGHVSYKAIDRYVLHPTHDVAAIRLADLMPSAHPVGLYTGSPQSLVNETLQCYGYGAASPGVSTPFVLRTAAMQVDRVDANNPWLILDVNSQGQLLYSGDSGGPCFVSQTGPWMLTSLHFERGTYDGGAQYDRELAVAAFRNWIFAVTDIWTQDECDAPVNLPNDRATDGPTLAQRQDAGGRTELHLMFKRESANDIQWATTTVVRPGGWFEADAVLPYSTTDAPVASSADDYVTYGTSVSQYGPTGSSVRLLHGSSSGLATARLRTTANGTGRNYYWSPESTLGAPRGDYGMAGDLYFDRGASDDLQLRQLRHGWRCRYQFPNGYVCGFESFWSVQNLYNGPWTSEVTPTMLHAGPDDQIAVAMSRVSGTVRLYGLYPPGVLAEWTHRSHGDLGNAGSSLYFDADVAPNGDTFRSKESWVGVRRDVFDVRLKWTNEEGYADPTGAWSFDRAAVLHHRDEYWMAFRKTSGHVVLRPVGNCLGNSPYVPWYYRLSLVHGTHTVNITP